jgi:hypothetical protein
MPMMDVAIPKISTGKCQPASSDWGQAIAPNSKTLAIEMR